MPRRNGLDYSGLSPWFGLSPSDLLGQGRTKGKAQTGKATATAGHSRRLTSGGKAECRWQMTFE